MFGISVVAAIVYAWIAVRRARRRVERWVRPIVETAGFEWVDERPAPLFRTGPFPWVTFDVGEVHTEIGGVSGESVSYHIIRVRRGDVVHEVWARARFAAFSFVEADFSPSLETLA